MKKEESIRILVAEDHEIVREGLVAILNMQKDMIVVAEAKNGEEAVRPFRKERPDIALLDLVMPDMSGVYLERHGTVALDNCEQRKENSNLGCG